MKRMSGWGVVAAVMAAGAIAMAAEGERPFHVESYLRLGYDDNVTYAEQNKIDTFFIREELALSFDKTYETGFLGLRYRPALDWYEDLGRDSETEWTHAVDVNWLQMLGRRLSLAVAETFIQYDRSEVVDSDGVLRQPNYGYIYNTAAGTLTALLTPTLRLSGSLRHQLFRYDDQLIADREDYDIWAYGASLGTQLGKATTVYVDGTIEDIAYEGSGKTQTVVMPGYNRQIVDQIPNRDAVTYNVGLGVERVFSPNLLGRVRGGYTYKDMEAANQSDDDSPYGEAQVTIIPVPTTRLTLSAAYSLYQSGLQTFANQTRTTFSASLAHDLTSRITLSLLGAYYQSDYDAEDSVNLVPVAEVQDGTETSSSLGVRVSYRLDRNNWIDLGYSYSNFDSDFRLAEGVDRNRYDVAWKIRL
ncbi:MAG: outer membrane beta-barrel protein [Kiritimatiellae bacterium]|nr:outer membrane beta-barrel protein [Kiritimatiellia bacterium]